MNYITCSQIFIIISSWIMGLVYIHIFLIEKKYFIKLWSITWTAYSSIFILKLLNLIYPNIAIIQIFKTIIFLYTNFLMLWSIHVFLENKFSKLLALSLIFISIFIIINYKNLVASSIVVSAIYLYSLILILKSKTCKAIYKSIAKWVLLSWGTCILNYFILYNNSLILIGNFITALVLLIFSLGVGFTYCKTKLNELTEKITKQNKMLNEITKQNKLKTDFFANISHELRTPLNIIVSTLQIFNFYKSEGNININNNKISKHFKTMQQNCFRLLRIINNLIDITKIDAGFHYIKLQNYNIVGLIENITSSVEDFTMNKGITIEFHKNVKEKIIACDPDKIERIMLNLLSNSIKFTKSGGKITVSVNDYKEYITISVKDTGIGIPQDKIKTIFERFEQVNELVIKTQQGSGIGLSLVKSFVQMHDGEIIVKSKYKLGSEFIIKLPVKKIFEEKKVKKDNYNQQNRIQTINIELSDIYS